MTSDLGAPAGPKNTTAGSKNTAWFHCFAGIAGDMALGSLLDAGANLEGVHAILEGLRVPGWELGAERVLRGGLSCTRAVVSARHDGTARSYAQISDLLEQADLPERVRRRAGEVFASLARVEAAVHHQPPAQVHFHEVGGHDAIVDVVGTVAALELLDVDDVMASPVATGTGTVDTAHGVLPNPAPAVLKLLSGAPVYGRSTPVELTTPTGAALLSALSSSFGPLPLLRVDTVGFGAGAAELADLPNCTQVVIGPTQPAGGDGRAQRLCVLETNLDDVTGERLALAVERLMAAGAHDAWLTPIVMKKGRPAHTLHALCDPSHLPGLRQLMVELTGTFGVRASEIERWALERRLGSVDVKGEAVRVKAGDRRVKPEFDDVVRAAERLGLGLDEVDRRAVAGWEAEEGPDPP